jgi:hypothetical protein
VRLATWFRLAAIAAAIIIVIQVGKTIADRTTSGCGLAVGVAHADTGGCPSVEELAADATWAGQRIQSLTTRPETAGRLYYPGLVNGFRVEDFTSGYQDAARADQAIADAGIVPPGRNLNVAAHVEVKAAAFMRTQSIAYAVLVINKDSGVCGANEKADQPYTCNSVIPGILPKGSILAVWSPVEVRDSGCR